MTQQIPGKYELICASLRENPSRWLITGVAGFIGSNLLQRLLELDQKVIGLDNFSTGYQHNLDQVRDLVAPERWQQFEMVEGDICDLATCNTVCAGVDNVLHQAALGSVPRSLEDPIRTNSSNVSGFLNILTAARDAAVKRFVYAASSSTYGDHPGLPKVEELIGNPLSPYAVTKVVNELYADVFSRCYGFHTIGLRYFNIFGPRQDPNGAYAAVIPKWIDSILSGETVFINGDGETSRDFCFIENAVQANLLAATTTSEKATNQIFNVAVGDRTTLNQLYEKIYSLCGNNAQEEKGTPVYRDFRAGDVRHSLADITKARTLLGYQPSFNIDGGLEQTVRWHLDARQSTVVA